jgi:transmembrane sensor
MAEIHRLPDAADALREAGEWLARLAADDVSAEDRARFQTWQAVHPQHARTYAAMHDVWREYEAAGPLVRAVSFGQTMNEVSQPKPRWLPRTLAAAAVLVMVCLGGGWWYVTRPLTEIFQTAVGERATIQLPDGSSLELNSNSLARVEYGKQSRVVYLDRGESFFNVIHDAQRPFQVIAAGSVIRDIGTAFDVDLRPAGLRVTVDEGTVEVGSAMSATPAATVSANERADIQGRLVTVRKLSAEDIARSAGWRTGILDFDHEPLADIVAEISRYTTTRIILQDPAIARMPMDGNFQANAQGAESLVSMLRDGLNLPVHKVGNAIYIGAPPSRAQ